MKIAIPIILSSVIFIIALFAILVGSITYVVNYKIHEIDTAVSPDEKYELILQQVGDPDWLFGSTHARVVLKEEWQSYKRELSKIASTIDSVSDSDIECCISAKGCPYAILKQEINKTTGEITEYQLIFNESYSDSSKHEYVLEEYIFSSNGEEVPSPTIIDFYLIDCETLEVTDEQINTWH